MTFALFWAVTYGYCMSVVLFSIKILIILPWASVLPSVQYSFPRIFLKENIKSSLMNTFKVNHYEMQVFIVSRALFQYLWVDYEVPLLWHIRLGICITYWKVQFFKQCIMRGIKIKKQEGSLPSRGGSNWAWQREPGVQIPGITRVTCVSYWTLSLNCLICEMGLRKPNMQGYYKNNICKYL